MFGGRRILLAVTGSIAAYKSAFLTRELVKEGAEVRILMTDGATRFVSPLTFSTLSKAPVIRDEMVFDPRSGEWVDHVHWGRWPDLILIAPATAHSIAKLAHGSADDILGLVHLSAECPVHFAPAMDLEMHRHPAVQKNIRELEEQGCERIAAREGELASGLQGFGRMEEPEGILQHLEHFFERIESLKGKRVLITGGPTHEAIDPVRFIGNRSSGKMGVALAEAAAKRGAEVTLVLGPSEVKPSDASIQVVEVESAEEMYEACRDRFEGMDLAIMAAAVADHRPAARSEEKLKKGEEDLTELKLEPTQDILASLGEQKKEGQVLVGFALESGNGEEEAQRKMKAKNADMIVLNSLEDEGAGFRHDTNKVTIHQPGNDPEPSPLDQKSKVAERILDRVLPWLPENPS